MDLPGNNHPFPPLITIRGLMLPRTSSTGPRLPPLVSIQGLATSAVHELPEEPQQIDVGQLFQAVNTKAQDENAEHQRLFEDLDEAQRMLEALEASSQWHESKIKEMKHNIRDEMQHHDLLRLDLGRTLEQVDQQQGVLQALREETADLEGLRAELTILRDMNAQLKKEAQELQHMNTDCISMRSELLVSVNNVERVSRQALQARESEIYGLKSQLTTSEENLKRVNGEAETLRNRSNNLHTEIANLKSQLAASQSKAEQVERDVEALQIDNSDLRDSNSKLRNDNTEISNLRSQLAASQRKAEQAEREAGALRIDNGKLRTDDTEVANLKSRLSTSNANVDRLEKEAEALRIDNGKLRTDDTEVANLKSELSTSNANVDRLEREAKIWHDENEKLRNEITEISELKSQLAASSDSKIERLEGEAKTLHDENEKLRNEITEISELKSQLAASSDSKIERLEGEAKTLHDKNEKLRNEITEISELKSQLAAASDSKIERLEGEAATLHENNKKLHGDQEKLRSDHEKLRDDHEKVRQENEDLEKLLDTGRMAVDECERLGLALKELGTWKRIYLERYLSLRGAIRVVCRIRRDHDPSDNPEGIRLQISNDTDGASLEVYRKVKSSLAAASVRAAPENRKAWGLDQIFSPTDDNDTIWEEVKLLLESAMDGAQVVVILYGRTGTGKSFTSEGIWSHLGKFLFPDTDDSGSGNDDFGIREESTSSGDSRSDEGAGDLREEQVRLWATEIYCGELRDLLAMKQKNGAAHGAKLVLPGSNGVLDPVRQCGATSVVMSDRQGLEAALGEVAKARKSGQTRANDKSSRSHAFTCVELPGGGSITLVDLAGHERDGVGSSPTELQSINKSLSALTHALGKLVSSMRKAGRAPRGESGQQANPKKASVNKNMKATPPTNTATPDKTAPTTGIENVWSSPELLPRVVGALMQRGSGNQHGGIKLKSKVMFLATLDFATLDVTMGSEQTLADLQNSGLITNK